MKTQEAFERIYSQACFNIWFKIAMDRFNFFSQLLKDTMLQKTLGMSWNDVTKVLGKSCTVKNSWTGLVKIWSLKEREKIQGK